MRTRSARLGIVGAGAVVLALVAAVIASGDDSRVSPLPLGTSPAAWTAPDGSPVLDLVPDRAPVSTLDGRILKRADGTPVTAPQGELYRGEITEEEADRQFAEVERLQREDACRRGIEVPVSASVEGSYTQEELVRLGEKALAKAIAANGGRATISAC